MAEPAVQNYTLAGLKATFTLVNSPLSLANALRRTIVSDIPCVVLHTKTDEDDGPVFHSNTSRQTNEMIAQRLACIPVHITDPRFPYQEYSYSIDKTNTGDSIEYITSADIVLRETTSARAVTAAETGQIFPADINTGDHIDIVRLRPKLAKTMVGETLHVSGKLALSTAGQNGCHALASACTCIGTRDKNAVDQGVSTLEKKLVMEKKTAEEIALAKSDFLLLDASRLTIPDSYDFAIEAVGPLKPQELAFRAIDILVTRLRQLKSALGTDTARLQDAPGTIPNAFLVELHGDGYTLGRLLEGYIYDKYYTSRPGKDPLLSFCGFRKPHPHIPVSTIKIAFVQETARAGALAFVDEVIEETITVVTSLSRFFSD